MSELRAGTPITAAGITLIPIERVRIDSGTQPHAYWFNATKEAVAVVICAPEGPRAVDVQAHEWPLDELIAQVPELEAVLTKARPPRLRPDSQDDQG